MTANRKRRAKKCHTSRFGAIKLNPPAHNSLGFYITLQKQFVTMARNKKPGASMRTWQSVFRLFRRAAWFLREDFEQVAQVFRPAGIVKKRLQTEDLLHRP